MEVRVRGRCWSAVGVTVGGVWRETDDSHATSCTHPAISAVAGSPRRQGGRGLDRATHASRSGRGCDPASSGRGRLHRIHHGVYAVGHPRLTPRGHLWGAVLACGGPEAAVLSHRSAAAVWDLLPSPAKFDVTTLGTARSTPRRSASTAAQTLTPSRHHPPRRPARHHRRPHPHRPRHRPSPRTASSASSTARNTSASSTHTPSMRSSPEPPAAAPRPSDEPSRHSPPTTPTSPARSSRSGSSP